MTKAAFEQELTSVINRYSMEKGSNTPDFILARYLIECLEAFERCSNERQRWYGADLRIGSSTITAEAPSSDDRSSVVPID